MRMQDILDSSFARPGSAPIWGGKKVEFRDWTSIPIAKQGFRFRPVAGRFVRSFPFHVWYFDFNI